MRSRLTVRNHRGAEVPAVLGFVILAGGFISTLFVAVFDRVPAEGWIAAVGAGLVFAAGLADDLTGGGPRGLRDGRVELVGVGRVREGLDPEDVGPRPEGRVPAAVVVVGIERAQVAVPQNRHKMVGRPRGRFDG
jgi:hypothetical protein